MSRDLRVEVAGVTVIVGEAEIRGAGWMLKSEEVECYCEEPHCHEDSCTCAPDVAPALEVLTLWHNDSHPGVFRFCDERPCSDLREARFDLLNA